MPELPRSLQRQEQRWQQAPLLHVDEKELGLLWSGLEKAQQGDDSGVSGVPSGSIGGTLLGHGIHWPDARVDP
jgi:hypothetical protein